MSYILEAVRQSSDKRGKDTLKNAESLVSVAIEKDKGVNWKKWLTIAIAINIVLLFAWMIFNSSSTFDWQGFGNSSYEEIQQKLNGGASNNELSILVEEAPVKEIEVVDELAVADESDGKVISKTVPKSLPLVRSKDEIPDNLLAVETAQIDINREIDLIENSSEIEIIYEAKIESLPEDILPQETLSQNVNSSTATSVEEEVITPVELIPANEVDYPELRELPYSLQQEIPDINISVHIYNENSDARKARINGRLYYEGQDIDNDLTMEEIAVNAIIFDYAGTLFKVNIR